METVVRGDQASKLVSNEEFIISIRTSFPDLVGGLFQSQPQHM